MALTDKQNDRIVELLEKIADQQEALLGAVGDMHAFFREQSNYPRQVTVLSEALSGKR